MTPNNLFDTALIFSEHDLPGKDDIQHEREMVKIQKTLKIMKTAQKLNFKSSSQKFEENKKFTKKYLTK